MAQPMETSFGGVDDPKTPLLGVSATAKSRRRDSATFVDSFADQPHGNGDASSKPGPSVAQGDAVKVEVKVLRNKAIHLERQATKDLRRLGDGTWELPVLLDMPQTEPMDITTQLLLAITASASVSDLADEKMIRLLTSQERIFRDRAGEVASRVRTWGKTIQGPGYLIAYAESSAVKSRSLVAIGRLVRSVDLGGMDPIAKFVVIVIGPEAVAETKSTFEVGRTFSALFSDPEFYGAAIRATSPDDVRGAILDYLARHNLTGDTNGGNGASGSHASAGSQATLRRAGTSASGGIWRDAWGRGLAQDFRRRKDVYRADFTDVMGDSSSRMKLCSATMFIFCSNVANAVAFGAVNSKNTTPPGESVGYFGVREMLIAQAIGGILWAFVGGQPLVVVQTTGPLAVFFKVLFSWSKTLDTDFLPFYTWCGIWLCLLMMLIAWTGASRIMDHVTLYTMEIFALLVAGIFLSEAITWIVSDYTNVDPNDTADRSKFLLNFVLWSLVYLVGNRLLAARRSLLLIPAIRTVLADFGPILAIIIASAAAYTPHGISEINIDKLKLPDSPPWEPSLPREWVVDLGAVGVGPALIAFAPALLVTILFFLDHNTTGLLVNRPENKLKKGAAYHLDFVSLAVVNFVLSILGLPWVHGALPFSPMHAQALADVHEYQRHGSIARLTELSRETRLSNLIAHLLILGVVGARPLLEAIPTAVLYGFFLFVGAAALGENSLWSRVELIFTEPVNYPPNHANRLLSKRTLHCFTAVQLGVFSVLWLVKAQFYLDTDVPVSLLFPFVLAAVVPFRIKVLPLLFNPDHIVAILAGEEAEQSVFA